MAGIPRAAAGPLRTLWAAGAIGEADDAALIDRFNARGASGRDRDEAAEAAFRVLVERHGPMVRRVCRQVVGDDDAAQDAAQAVFLVLARKAGTIRVDRTVAPWLHGVARRVASKARGRAAAARAGQLRLAEAARADADSVPADTPPDWEPVHEEVARLPARYREPVVLCYLEGQTYEEAARRLGCPVGTVRVRLSRARDRLRDRLARRGYGPALVAPVARAFEAPVPPAPAPEAWVDATVAAVRAWGSAAAAAGAGAGGAVAAGAVPAAVLALSDEVIGAIAMGKAGVWGLGVGVITLGLVSAGAWVRAGGTAAHPDGAGQQSAKGAPAPAPGAGPAAALPGSSGPAPAAGLPGSPAPAAPGPEPADSDREILVRLRDAALDRLNAQRRFYEEGRLTLDRYLDASRQLMEAQLQLATTREERVDATRAHLDLAQEIVRREQTQIEVGRGTKADLAEARVALARAELDVRRAFRSQEIGSGAPATPPGVTPTAIATPAPAMPPGEVPPPSLNPGRSPVPPPAPGEEPTPNAAPVPNQIPATTPGELPSPSPQPAALPGSVPNPEEQARAQERLRVLADMAERERALARREAYMPVRELARARLEERRNEFADGLIPLDRYADASRILMAAELAGVTTPLDRYKAAGDHLNRMEIALMGLREQAKRGKPRLSEEASAQRAVEEASRNVQNVLLPGDADNAALRARVDSLEAELNRLRASTTAPTLPPDGGTPGGHLPSR